MGGGGGIADLREDIAQRGGGQAELQTIDKAESGLTRLLLEFERQQPSVVLTFEQIACQDVMGVAGKPGVVDASNGRMLFQEACHLQRVSAMAFHAQVQRSQAPEKQVRLKRAEYSA